MGREPARTVHPARDDVAEPLARLRAICRALPGTSEKVSHGEPTFLRIEDGSLRTVLPAIESHAGVKVRR